MPDPSPSHYAGPRTGRADETLRVRIPPDPRLGGHSLSGHGFAHTEEETREIAERIAGPVVIKSPVLTGGRMKAGGVKLPIRPRRPPPHARDILQLEINDFRAQDVVASVGITGRDLTRLTPSSPAWPASS